MGKILIIEDAEVLRRTIVDLLEIENHLVLEAENGLIGLNLAREKQPDLVICDVMLPKLDGYGVLKTLRADVFTFNIPFLFLSAKVTEKDLDYGLSLGARAYLTKPFTLSKLMGVIDSCLSCSACVLKP